MNHRLSAVALALVICLLLVVLRLFYWQILRGDELSKTARSQYHAAYSIGVPRGLIRTSDNFPLVANKPVYTLAVDPMLLKDERKMFSDVLPLVAATASESAKRSMVDKWQELLAVKNVRWVPLAKALPSSTAESIGNLSVSGLELQMGLVRDYPEASMAANLLGIVASDKDGNQKGYFGLEGFYDRELEGHPGLVDEEKDARGQPILLGKFEKRNSEAGRDLVLNIDRGAQFIAESTLADGLKQYGAGEGTVTVMNPKTGAVLAMTSLPTYDPRNFAAEDTNLFHNSVVGKSFEPGSIFKPVVMAAALNEKVITPETTCDRCSGPWKVGEYWIHTWNDKYYSGESMADVIVHSDNVGMTFVADRLGGKKMLSYFKKFGVGQPTGIDLEDEDFTPMRDEKDWYPIDYATVAFGQGIAMTPIQVIRAIAAIANGGVMMEPHVVAKIVGDDGDKVIAPKSLGRIVSQEAAETTTRMMVSAVENGEAKWARIKGFKVAGKTGTAQITISGKYDKEKTNASFVGFLPADNPKFVMLVTLHDPQTSPWAAETAAPLWFVIAKRLIVYWGVANFF